jgi:NTE family protein
VRELLAALAVLLPALLAADSVAACERARAPVDVPTALVLSGGGAKGAWEAGVAIAFMEHGVPVRLAAGSSAGALNAAMLADGRLERLETLWRTITRDQVYALRSSVVVSGLLPGFLSLFALDRAGSLFDPRPLRALVTEALDLDRVRRSPLRLLVVTADLARRAPRLFDNATLTVDALMAAAAVPGAFPPVEIDGDLLVDGGLVGRAPVLDALDAGVPVARAIVVMSYAPGEAGQRPTTLRRTLEEALEMAMIHQIRRDTELARLKYPATDVQLLTPSAPLALRPLEFDSAGMTRAFLRGRADAAACLDRWRGAQ